MATLRWGGVIGVLMWVAPSIEAFFLWQGLVSVVTILIFILVLYENMPDHSLSGRFSWFQLNGVGSFASGMMMQTLLTLILTQADKIILSRLLSLEMFGYYTLAGTFANILIQMISPITLAQLPRFTELVTKGDTTTLIKIYHQGAQLVSVIIATGAMMFMFFGEAIILLWGGNSALANNVAPLLALLALGTMLNGLMHSPYILILAYGLPGSLVRVNMVAIVVMVPAIFWITPRYGAIGAAWIWVVLNVGYLLIASRILYQRLLITEIWNWYRYDIIQPVIGAALMAITFSLIHSRFSSSLIELLWIFLGGLCILVASALSAPSILKNLIHFVRW
jgi:O-antigen/teichoic acid export membrane protein